MKRTGDLHSRGSSEILSFSLMGKKREWREAKRGKFPAVLYCNPLSNLFMLPNTLHCHIRE
jgi:hypothetical protein